MNVLCLLFILWVRTFIFLFSMFLLIRNSKKAQQMKKKQTPKNKHEQSNNNETQKSNTATMMTTMTSTTISTTECERYGRIYYDKNMHRSTRALFLSRVVIFPFAIRCTLFITYFSVYTENQIRMLCVYIFSDSLHSNIHFKFWSFSSYKHPPSRTLGSSVIFHVKRVLFFSLFLLSIGILIMYYLHNTEIVGKKVFIVFWIIWHPSWLSIFPFSF